MRHVHQVDIAPTDHRVREMDTCTLRISVQSVHEAILSPPPDRRRSVIATTSRRTRRRARHLRSVPRENGTFQMVQGAVEAGAYRADGAVRATDPRLPPPASFTAAGPRERAA